jgi:hypothetical protein
MTAVRILLSAMVLLIAGPALAGPRLTLTLQDATLHQTLKAVRERTGLFLRGSDGEGLSEWEDPPDARRASFNWSGAPVGRVIRDICRSYGLTGWGTESGGGYIFQRGTLPDADDGPASGLAGRVRHAGQAESFRVTPGHPGDGLRRSISLGLSVRVVTGEAYRLGPLRRLTLVDEQGNSHDLRVDEKRKPSEDRLPDEADYHVSGPWPYAQPARLKSIQGEVAMYAAAVGHRVTLPLAANTPHEVREGPIILRLRDVRTAGEESVVAYRLEWPADVELILDGAGSVVSRLKDSSGAYHFLQGRPGVRTTPDGSRFADLQARVQLAGAKPAVLELQLWARGRQDGTATFRIEDVTLPLDRELPKPNAEPEARVISSRRPPPGPEAPEAYRDLAGGILSVPAPAAVPVGRVLVGLSRRQGNVWSPLRWVELRYVGEPLPVPSIAAGTYRVQLRYSRSLPDGSLRPVRAHDRTVTVTIARGKTAAIR